MLKLSLKNSNYHNPVLPTIAIDWLAVQPGEKYIDATLGGGSHTAEIIRRGGKVLGLDQDPDAISACLALPKLKRRRVVGMLERLYMIQLAYEACSKRFGNNIM